MQPPYLHHHLISVQPPRSTRSPSVVTLARPPTSSSLPTTDRSFRSASSCLWKQLPVSLHQPHPSLSTSGSPLLMPLTSSWVDHLNFGILLRGYGVMVFNLGVHFSKYSTPPSGETIRRCANVVVMQKWFGPLLSRPIYDKFNGLGTSHPDYRDENVRDFCLCVCPSRF